MLEYSAVQRALRFDGCASVSSHKCVEKGCVCRPERMHRPVVVKFVDISVYPRTLYNSHAVVMGFPMPNDVHCFYGGGG